MPAIDVRMEFDDRRLRMLTRFDFVKQGDVSVLCFWACRGYVCDDVQVLDVRKLLVESREFVEMGSKEAECVDLGRDVPIWAVNRIIHRICRRMLTRILPKQDRIHRKSKCLVR